MTDEWVVIGSERLLNTTDVFKGYLRCERMGSPQVFANKSTWDKLCASWEQVGIFDRNEVVFHQWLFDVFDDAAVA